MAPSMEDNVTIIGVVKQYPILFDMAHPDYKDKLKKSRAWLKAGQQLNMTGENLKKKWKNLRDCYFKHLKCFTNTPGSRLKTYERYKKWQWAREMEFLKEYMALGLEIESVDTNQNTVMFTKDINYKAITVPPLELSNAGGAMKEPRRTFANNVIGDDVSYTIPKSNELSSLQHLMLSYAKTLETFSERRQSITKMKIAQIIMEAELEEFDEVKIRNTLNNPYYSQSHDMPDDKQIESTDVVIKEET